MIRQQSSYNGQTPNDSSDYDYDFVPWQPASDHTTIDEAARYSDFPVSVFSPTGRLFPLEAAVRASKTKTQMSNLVIAAKCKDGLVIMTTLPISLYARDHNKTMQSLFLWDEDTEGPIFDMHPCIVGATAGNAVDNRILKDRLMNIGLSALEETDIYSSVLAKAVANQLQVVTQDIGEAQKQRLGRMLASSALILGSQEIWRIDPTGQFWNCHATVIGEDAEKTEDLFYKHLLKECQDRQSPRELLESLSPKEALKLVQSFLETKVTKEQEHQERMLRSKASISQPVESDVSSTEESKTEATTTASDETDVSLPPVYWQAVILDYSSLTKGNPKRTWKRGIFGVNKNKA